MDTRAFDRLVVIGGSAGGVAALLELARELPAGFAAPVCIVQHVGAHASVLPTLLQSRGPNPAVHAHDGQRLVAGVLHVAPPDRHLVVDGGVLRLSDGPKEHHARPAIDPLFRSAALAWGPRVIGVVLSGLLDDGSAGLRAVKDHGGIAIAQDPATAVEAAMPAHAIAAAQVDHCLAPAAIGRLLAQLVQPGRGPAGRARAA